MNALLHEFCFSGKKKGTESQDNVSQWEVVKTGLFLWCIENHLLNYYNIYIIYINITLSYRLKLVII